MQGAISDPGHGIAGATWDGNNLVQGVAVTHVVYVGTLDHFLSVQTTVTNNTQATVGVLNLGDALQQQGVAGYHFAVPATYDVNGNVLNPRWGVEIPGSDFSRPLATAVQAHEVALFSPELSANSTDTHCAIGILPMDANNLLVTSDPQDLFTQARPAVPQRLVVGSLATTGLAPGASVQYNRRYYFQGGPSGAATYPSSTSGIFNTMDNDKFVNLRPQSWGWFHFYLGGTAIRQGPVPAEIRIERNVGTAGSPVWELQRVEFLSPVNSISTPGSFPSSAVDALLPTGTYRVVARNQTSEFVRTLFTNVWVNPADRTDNTVRYLQEPVVIQPNLPFVASAADFVAPEAAQVMDAQGVPVTSLYAAQTFTSHERNSPPGNLQPERFTFIGTNGTPNPSMRRMVNVDSVFSAANRGPALATAGAAGQYQFRGGNMMFGTAFTNLLNTEFAFLPNPPYGSTAQNTYTVYGTRGPLSNLMSLPVAVYEGQLATSNGFITFPMGLPSKWTSFDLPGPSQATTGGYGNAEKLTSAMAEGVQVVAATEMDVQVDPVTMYSDYMFGTGYPGLTSAQRTASLSDILRLNSTNGTDPYVVGARTSNLTGFGTVTALFPPTATPERNGGAMSPTGWTLADFITQAGGAFNVVNRPRGPAGLFTLKGFDPTVPLGKGVNAWWNGTGPLAFGATHGGFDAIELLHAEGFDGTNAATATAWFNEFKQVRNDWFALLNQQPQTSFTKGLGFSGALFSLDTPVGLARTYLKAFVFDELDLTSVLGALQAGEAVASTGPFLDVSVAGVGPGGLVAGPNSAVTLAVTLTMTDWMPVDELRVIVNGQQVAVGANGQTFTGIPTSALTQSTSDPTRWSGTFTVAMPTAATGSWIVVEAGVPLSTTGLYRAGTPWNQIMMGIYPIAVTNPIFVDVTGAGYTPPGL